MAVDTGAHRPAVLHQRLLVEGAEAALVEAHRAEHLVARSYAAVGDAPGADGVVADVDAEVAVACPAAVASGTDRDAKAVATVGSQQAVPLVYVELRTFPIHVHRAALAARHLHVDGRDAVAEHREVQRGNVEGNRHAHVIGIYLWQLIALLGILPGDNLSATDEESGQAQEQERAPVPTGRIGLGCFHSSHAVC